MKKTVVKDTVEMYGITEGKDACHNCVDLDKTVNERLNSTPEIPIEYKHFNVETDELGKQVAKSENISEIPYVKYCKIAEDETKKCETIVGYNEKDWKNLGKKREEEF